ncbi:MAG: PDZ domain-containing protein [Rubripirellula sp.]
MMRLMLPTLLGIFWFCVSCPVAFGQQTTEVESPTGSQDSAVELDSDATDAKAADAAQDALAAATQDAKATDGDADSIDYWVSQLGHDHYLRREKASEKLVLAGVDAIPALVQVIRVGDLEVIERATEVLTEIAFARAPAEDGGAWEQLSRLATQAVGRRASSARIAIQDIRQHRAEQAREALATAGVFVGMDEFAISSITLPRLIVQIDSQWRGDLSSLQWLEWLSGVEYARIKGDAVVPEVLRQVVKIPGLQSIALADVEQGLEDATLDPLLRMNRIHSMEFRYVPLTEQQGDVIASMPIRFSLNLMGTGISSEKVEWMRGLLPGLKIDHRQGGFLGVTCLDGFDACEINSVVVGGAAERAGLIKGDVVVQIGEREVGRFKDLQDAINQHLPGDEVEVRFRRGDKIESVTLRLGRFEES